MFGRHRCLGDIGVWVSWVFECQGCLGGIGVWVA